MSYSHAADDLLAPRLQVGLQRFAKPWWKRRALRIFRDESSLSANPHLWSSITDALDGSDWFVLLLSPDAAESEWVNQEVEYWLEHKDPNRIIPVVTDGEFRWAESDIDLESDAAPPALYGAFSDEPRWVDLRFARSEEQLDLTNPRFSAGVADVASAIRGVPKDELESEEVRQHRRTVRTAWAAGAGLLILALLAGAAAIFALDQRNDAQQSQSVAENAAEAEKEARAEAEANAAAEAEARQEAEAQRLEAEQQAAIAQGRELTLEAEQALEVDPELSAHLALASLALLQQAGEDPAQAVSALRAAVENDRVVWRVPGGDFVAVHPDGSLLATADENDVAIWNIEAREVVERYRQDDAFASGAAFSRDGSLLAVGFLDAENPVTVWDRASRDSFTLGNAGFPADFSFSPGDEYLAFATRGGSGLEVWSIDERSLVYQDASARAAEFNADGLLAYAVGLPDETGARSANVQVRIVDPASWEVVNAFTSELTDPNFSGGGAANVAWSPDGGLIAVQDALVAVVLDAKTGDEVSRTQNVDLLHRPEWLSLGDEFVVAGVLQPRVIDAATGEVRVELLGLGEGIGSWDYDAVPGTTLVAAAALGPGTGVRAGDTVLFETSPVLGEVGGWESKVEPWRGTGYASDGRVVVAGGFLDGSVLSAEADDGGDEVFLQGGSTSWFPDLNANGTFFTFADPEGVWTLRATDSGEVIYQAPAGWQILGASWDGAKAVIRQPFDADPTSELGCGPSRIVSTPDGSVIAELSAVECSAHPFFSPDGTLLFTASFFGETALFDAATGEVLVDFTGTKYNSIGGVFTPDGAELVIALEPVFVLDVATLLSGAPIADAERLAIPADAFQGLSVSPDGKWIATTTRDEPLRVWSLKDGEPVGEFGRELRGGFHLGDFHPSRPHLLVATPPNEIRIYTLDVDELIAIAEAGRSREMTEEECQRYFRGPCP